MGNEWNDRIKSIIREISSLKSVISETNEMLNLYPDDSLIELGLDSLEYRQSQLFHELESEFEYRRIGTFDIKIESPNLQGSAIPFSFLSSFLGSYQNLIESILEKNFELTERVEKNCIDIKSLSQLTLTAVGAGSFVIIYTTPPTLDRNPIYGALQKFSSLIEFDDNCDELTDFGHIYGQKIIKHYGDLLKVIKNNRAKISFYENLGKSEFDQISIDYVKADQIFKVLNHIEEKPDEIVVLNGRIRAVDYDKYGFRFVSSLNDQEIRGKFDPKLRNQLRNPNFEEEVRCELLHSVSYNEIEDKEKENWVLLKMD